jgi:hypothetical protein
MLKRLLAASRPARQVGAVGSRELFSMLCEELAEALHASDCFVSRWDPLRSVTAGVAGFTSTPERWRLAGGEYQLDRYPVTQAVLNGRGPYTTWIGDPDGDPAERELLRSLGLTAGLLLRLEAQVPFLVEVWSDRRSGVFTPHELAQAAALVKQASRRLGAALARDAAREEHFRRAADNAREIGVADPRFAEMASAVGEAMQLDEESLDELRLVALVHDAGRSAIPAALLEKRDPLTPVEWAVVQRHTLVGQRMIERMPYLAGAVAGVVAIRERWDGEGYPARLRGAQIPLPARIVAVCSAYVAMREGRRGRPQLDHAEAMDQLEACAGSQFDPAVVQAMCVAVEPEGPRSVVRLRVAAI